MIARNTIGFLILASILYPLGLLFIPMTITALQVYIVITPLYIYVVAWSAIELNQELLEND